MVACSPGRLRPVVIEPGPPTTDDLLQAHGWRDELVTVTDVPPEGEEGDKRLYYRAEGAAEDGTLDGRLTPSGAIRHVVRVQGEGGAGQGYREPRLKRRVGVVWGGANGGRIETPGPGHDRELDKEALERGHRGVLEEARRVVLGTGGRHRIALLTEVAAEATAVVSFGIGSHVLVGNVVWVDTEWLVAPVGALLGLEGAAAQEVVKLEAGVRVAPEPRCCAGPGGSMITHGEGL